MPAVPPWVWGAALTLVCGLALWKGGPSERLAAVLFYGAWILTRITHDPDRFATQWAVSLVDGALFASLTLLALKSDRYWPIFAAGFDLLSIITHLARALDATLPEWAYYTAAQIWAYLTIGALGLGTWNSWRDRRRGVAP